MKIKVISDGTTYGTRVINIDTQEELKGVSRVEIVCDANDREGLAVVTLRMIGVPVDVDCYMDNE